MRYYVNWYNYVNLCGQELTKAQYNMTFRRDGSLMPSTLDADTSKGALQNSIRRDATPPDPVVESKFFSPAFFGKQVIADICLYIYYDFILHRNTWQSVQC